MTEPVLGLVRPVSIYCGLGENRLFLSQLGSGTTVWEDPSLRCASVLLGPFSTWSTRMASRLDPSRSWAATDLTDELAGAGWGYGYHIHKHTSLYGTGLAFPPGAKGSIQDWLAWCQYLGVGEQFLYQLGSGTTVWVDPPLR